MLSSSASNVLSPLGDTGVFEMLDRIHVDMT